MCLKSTAGYGINKNITVINTIIRSKSSAIKFGSNTDEDMYDIHFENITIRDSHRGIGF